MAIKLAVLPVVAIDVAPVKPTNSTNELFVLGRPS